MQMELIKVPILPGMLLDGLRLKDKAPARVRARNLVGAINQPEISNKDIKVDTNMAKDLGKALGSTKARIRPCNQPHLCLHLLAHHLRRAGILSAHHGWLSLRREASAEQTLKLIAQQIQQNPDSATPEVHASVQRHKTQGKKQYTKGLHSAVKYLGQARQALDDAISARSHLMSRRRAFLNASLKQWKDYTDMFQAQEKACQEQIAAARDGVSKAK